MYLVFIAPANGKYEANVLKIKIDWIPLQYFGYFEQLTLLLLEFLEAVWSKQKITPESREIQK